MGSKLKASKTMKDPSTSFLDILDLSAYEADNEALPEMGIWALTTLGHAQAANSAGTCIPGLYRIARKDLTAILAVLHFDTWQSSNHVEFLFVGDRWAMDSHTLPTGQAATLEVSNREHDPLWQRIADLALLSAGYSVIEPPMSHSFIDSKHILVDAQRLGYLLKCARFESWNEPGFSANPSLAAMKAVIANA